MSPSCWNSPATARALALFVDSYAGRIDGRLTAREIEITRFLISGFSAKEIAQSIDIAPYTVRKHMRSVYLKLQVSSQARLCARFLEFMIDSEAVRYSRA